MEMSSFSYISSILMDSRFTYGKITEQAKQYFKSGLGTIQTESKFSNYISPFLGLYDWEKWKREESVTVLCQDVLLYQI